MNGKKIKISDTEYFLSDAISNSFCIEFERSPIHAVTKRSDTSAMSTGRLIHSYFLDKIEFENNYFICSENITDKRKKEYQDIKKEYSNKIVLLSSEIEEIKQIEKNLLSYDIFLGFTFEELIKKADAEISIFWQDENNINRKSKIDALIELENYNIIIDLKTTENANNFISNVITYQYHRQAAFYVDAVKSISEKPSIFIFLVIEKSMPFGIKAYSLDSEYIAIGKKQNEEILQKIKIWIEDDKKLKGYEGLEMLQPPKWLVNKIYEN